MHQDRKLYVHEINLSTTSTSEQARSTHSSKKENDYIDYVYTINVYG
jgi:hypothetical protein